ncbi:MAG TPA: nucleoside-diphosphate kinase [Eubacteriaceae bacterium]|nr:nucleoside-diphosphate kinase [Eubacteriaceae bacterium]
MAQEKTLVIFKPDAVKKQVIGKLITRIEEKGFGLEYMQLKTLTDEELETHYEEHKDKPFFKDLKAFMKSGPVVVAVVAGENAIKSMRVMAGATDPLEADAGSIRAMYAESKGENIIHCSDSPESAQREINIFTK